MVGQTLPDASPLPQVAARGASTRPSVAFLEELTKALAVELAPNGITVNEVAPGPVDTAYLRANVSPDAYQQRIDRSLVAGDQFAELSRIHSLRGNIYFPF